MVGAALAVVLAWGGLSGSPGSPPPTIETPDSLVAVDLDADLLPDLLVGFGRVDGAVFRNEGGGSFRPVDWLPPGVRADDIRCVDVDRDGDPDLITVSASGSRLFLNQDGRLVDSTPTHFAQAVGARCVTPLDLEHDGDIDLLLGRVNAPAVVMVNDGTGRFVCSLESIPPHVEAVGCAVAVDLDHDEDLDLVLAGVAPDPQNRVLINDGAGRFVDETPQRLPPNEHECGHVVAADLDRDGDLDVVVTGSRVLVYVNDGFGRFTDHSAAWLPEVGGRLLQACDLDGDADVDLLVGHQGGVSFFRNDSGSRLIADDERAFESPIRTPVDALALIDLDRDADLDLVTRTGGRTRIDLGRDGLLRKRTVLKEPNRVQR